MALTFPPNPAVGDEYQGGTGSWLWNTHGVWERGAGPAPMITALVPPTGQINAPIDVTIQGANFTPVSIVRHDNINAPGVFVSATEMTTVMPSNPTAGTVVQVHVRDNLQISNSLPFTYEAVPLALISLNPNDLMVESQAITLFIDGTGFLPTSEVIWEGVPVTPTYVNGGRVTIPVSGIAQIPHIVQVQVQNGAVVSNALPFEFYPIPPDVPNTTGLVPGERSMFGVAAFELYGSRLSDTFLLHVTSGHTFPLRNTDQGGAHAWVDIDTDAVGLGNWSVTVKNLIGEGTGQSSLWIKV